MVEQIDLVIAYVDNAEEVWQKTFTNYCLKYNQRAKLIELHTIRFEDKLSLLPYQLKLIQKNMTFINKIYLLVSNKEQAPKNLPSNCEIVVHKDFIPYKYLPTFNSTTIEMFLWNIKGLSEHFIYTNDDMLPTQMLQESNFFVDDKIKITLQKKSILENHRQYRCHCLNNDLHICEKLNINHDKIHYLMPLHSMTPMIKSHCVECYKLIKDKVEPYITRFRTDYNHNQYIFPLYEHYKYGVVPSDIDFLYTQLKEDIDLNHQIVCLNIIPSRKVEELKKELDKICE